MYRTVSRSSMQSVIGRLSVTCIVAGLSLLVTNVQSAAGSQGKAAKAAKRSPRHGGKRSSSAALIFGGFITEDLPVVIQISADGREVVRASMDVPQKCNPSGNSYTVPDSWVHLPIRAAGAFQGAYEGTPFSLGNNLTGTTAGQVNGQFNRSMTKVTGTWNFSMTVRDTTGAVIDKCESGAVSFTAIQ
jgi:hypothetical protein